MKINIPEFSVSQFSRAIKSAVEDAFGYVRIRGEITGFKKANSGHLYFSLKEENSIVGAVCFRNSAQNLNFEIADGLQVCVSGKVTTFEGRSNYQIIIEKIEIAGLGAILEMLEKRKQKLANEGLFDVTYKKSLPYFPRIIGVITSASGAVIEDIKNRINARCPTAILLYSVTVQGEKAVSEICGGIKYFNSLKQNRPDILIIARGGGSFEDLIIFNDEELVRCAFKSDIPIISAIGHETDHCLLDLVADVRAPTPSAAAEIATIVLSDVKNQIFNLDQRLNILLNKFFVENFNHINNLSRFIVSPKNMLSQQQKNLEEIHKKITFLLDNFIANKISKINNFRISPQFIVQKINYHNQQVDNQFLIVFRRLESYVLQNETAFKNLQKSLTTNHYQNILKRGFVLIKNSQNQLIDSVSKIQKDQLINIEFGDGKAQAKIY
jgi:exodeoxyribonuclease VII large subunit